MKKKTPTKKQTGPSLKVFKTITKNPGISTTELLKLHPELSPPKMQEVLFDLHRDLNIRMATSSRDGNIWEAIPPCLEGRAHIFIGGHRCTVCESIMRY